MNSEAKTKVNRKTNFESKVIYFINLQNKQESMTFGQKKDDQGPK